MRPRPSKRTTHRAARAAWPANPRSAESAELASLGGGQASGAIGGQAPGLRIERHRHFEFEHAPAPRFADADAAERPPLRPLLRREPLRHPLDAVNGALAEAHGVSSLFTLARFGARLEHELLPTLSSCTDSPASCLPCRTHEHRR